MLVKAFRLFVSSTFADFAAERNVLQRKVFPALEGYCASKGYQFLPLDLRWGVNEEAQLDQRTAEICRNEVRAAKRDYPPPNFLIMLGNRYGLVPLPYAIAQDEFETILAWLGSQGRQDAVQALSAVYRYDGNHLVPRGLSSAQPDGTTLVGAYTLRSRIDELPELRAAEAWAERENELRTILQQVADALLGVGRINQAAHEKYFLSLTDQEIIYGLPGYRPAFRDEPLWLSLAASGPPAIAFIREIATDAGVTQSALSHYFQESPYLDALKDGIKRTLPPDHIVIARAVVDANGRFSEAYLADFAKRIQAKLQDAIDQYIARVAAIERTPDYALTSEREAHRAFAHKKLEMFVGREDVLVAIDRYLAVPGDHPLVLHGRSGFGKSAVMARAVATAGAAGRVPVVARFVGASAPSSNLRSLLISVIEDLAAQGVVTNPAKFEQDANKFNAQIEKLLASISSPTIVFVDALDQLQRPRDLWWVPVRLPKVLKFVVSVLDDPAYESESDLYRGLRDRFPPYAFVEIGPLNQAQARELLSALERQRRHRLQDNQRDYLVERYDDAGGSPLYLKTAFEISRSWKSYHAARAGRYVLAGDTEGIISQFIDELSSVQHHEPELVSRTLGFLSAANSGLSVKEMTDVLSRDVGVMRAISSERFGALTDKLPPSLWVRLNRDLSPLLVEKQINDQPLLQFFHRQVARVARAQHYEPCKIELHAALAAYFDSAVTESDRRRIYGKRSLSELPYQLHHAECTTRLGEILMSPDWMQQKLNAFGPRPLIDDYEYARTKAQALIGEALDLAAPALVRNQLGLAAQIIGRVGTNLVDNRADAQAISAILKSARTFIKPPAAVPRWPSFTVAGGGEIRRIESTSWVNCVAFSPDGRRVISGAKDGSLRLWEVASGCELATYSGHTETVTSVAFSPDGRHIVSGSADKTLRLWDTASRRSRSFVGHTSWVLSVAFSPDVAHVASGGGDEDHTVRLWETASGREVGRFDGHTWSVGSVAFSPDDRHIASGSSDHTVRVWEIATGKTRWLSSHNMPVSSVVFSPDGRYVVSGGNDYKLRLWDAATGREIKTFEGHTRPIESVAFSPDGRRVVSGSSDNTLRLWDIAGGQSRSFDGHNSFVESVAFSPEGRYIVSGSADMTLRVWDAGRERSRGIESHADNVSAVAFSPDGRYIVSGSFDKTLLLWEASSGRAICRLEGHSDKVASAAFSSDGRYIVSGSADKTLRVWEAENGREITRLEVGHWASAVTFLHDDRHIVSCALNHSLQVCDLLSRRQIALFKDVHNFALSPDGRQIVFWSIRFGKNHVLQLWEPSSTQPRVFAGHTDSVFAVAFSRDGRSIVSGSADKTLRIWDVASGQSRSFVGHSGEVKAVAFSLNGQQIVSAERVPTTAREEHQTLRLWEVGNGQSRSFLGGHASYVKLLAFSSDGRHIISGSFDDTIRLWQEASGRQLARLEGERKFSCFALAPGGKRLAAGDGGGRVHLVDILFDQSDKAIWLRSFGNEFGEEG